MSKQVFVGLTLSAKGLSKSSFVVSVKTEGYFIGSFGYNYWLAII